MARCQTRASLRVRGGERREVERSHDVLRGPDHGFFIHLIRIVVNIPRQKRRTYLSPVNSIAVGLSSCRMTGVKVVLDPFYTNDTHCGRENIVEGHHQVPFWDRGLDLQRCHLREGMYSGVRTSRTLGQDDFAGNSSKALSENALHSREAGL